MYWDAVSIGPYCRLLPQDFWTVEARDFLALIDSTGNPHYATGYIGVPDTDCHSACRYRCGEIGSELFVDVLSGTEQQLGALGACCACRICMTAFLPIFSRLVP